MKALKAFIKPFEAPRKNVGFLLEYNFLKCTAWEGLRRVKRFLAVGKVGSGWNPLTWLSRRSITALHNITVLKYNCRS